MPGRAKRMRMHREIAAALEYVHATDLERHAGPLAHHLLEAAPLGRRRQGGRVTRPGPPRQASDRLAYEDAALLYASARSTRSSSPLATSAARRLELLLELGAAQTQGRPAWRHARTTLERAAALARELDRPEELARAALGICSAVVRRDSSTSR